MAYTAPTTMVPGQVFTASRWNTMVKDNFDTLVTLANTGQLAWDGTTFKVLGRLDVGAAAPDLLAQMYIGKTGQAAIDLHNRTTGGTPATGARWRLFVDNVGGGAGSCTFGFYDVANTRVAFGLTNTGSFLIGKTSGLTGAGDLDINGAFNTSGAATLSSLKVVNNVGFFNAAPISKLAVGGSRSGGGALVSLLFSLATYGLITDSTTA